MKIKIFFILILLFGFQLCISDELINLICLEIEKIIKEKIDPNSNIVKNDIENIYNKMIEFQKEKISLNKEKDIEEIKKVLLAIRDFIYIMKNHNIRYFWEEVNALLYELENTYLDRFSQFEKNSLILEGKATLENDFCTTGMKLCKETCSKPPRIHIKIFECNFENKSYHCECGL